MKKMTFRRLALATTALFLTSGALTAALAQPGSGGPTPTSPTETPLDGGASLLLAAGVGLGLKHLRQRRKARA